MLKALAVAIRQDKEIKGIEIGKEVKLPLFLNDIILYVWDPKNSTRKLLEIINKYSSVAGYSIHLHRSIAFLYISDKQKNHGFIQIQKASKKRKHLEINLTTEVKDLYNENLKP